MKIPVLIFLFAASFARMVCAQADASSATLRGIVLDPNGGAIANATLTLVNAEKGTLAKTISGANGT